ncbi:structural protein [Bacillus proteolyticus]|uniref:Structural protein n=1 Tax=Bacillus proteolyticus TaxID=2026192 RepID=A0AA44R7D9_9BACI|nr:structural protein [Bacillus proteolyticus]OJE45037.1 structural protein [Bacillus proteolyticus]
MRFLEKDVLRALTTPFIVEKLDGEYIYNMIRGDDNSKTWITYSELDNGAGRYTEGVESTSTILFQVDIWSFMPVKGDLKEAVNNSMKNIGFQRITTANLYEPDTKIYHYGMRFRTELKV